MVVVPRNQYQGSSLDRDPVPEPALPLDRFLLFLVLLPSWRSVLDILGWGQWNRERKWEQQKQKQQNLQLRCRRGWGCFLCLLSRTVGQEPRHGLWDDARLLACVHTNGAKAEWMAEAVAPRSKARLAETGKGAIS